MGRNPIWACRGTKPSTSTSAEILFGSILADRALSPENRFKWCVLLVDLANSISARWIRWRIKLDEIGNLLDCLHLATLSQIVEGGGWLECLKLTVVDSSNQLSHLSHLLKTEDSVLQIPSEVWDLFAVLTDLLSSLSTEVMLNDLARAEGALRTHLVRPTSWLLTCFVASACLVYSM